jgi:hypothetical protein
MEQYTSITLSRTEILTRSWRIPATPDNIIDSHSNSPRVILVTTLFSKAVRHRLAMRRVIGTPGHGFEEDSYHARLESQAGT